MASSSGTAPRRDVSIPRRRALPQRRRAGVGMKRLVRTVASATIALWTAAAMAGNGGAPNSGEAAPSASPPPPQAAPALPPPAPAQNKGTPALVLDTADYENLLGQGVRAQNGDDLGRIIDVIIDKDGRPRAAIIDFGGFLGVGSRKIAVDWRVLSFAADGKPGSITLLLNRNQVRVSPEYKTGEPIVVLGTGSPGAPAPEAEPAPQAAAPQPAPQKPAEKSPEKAPEKPAEKLPE